MTTIADMDKATAQAWERKAEAERDALRAEVRRLREGYGLALKALTIIAGAAKGDTRASIERIRDNLRTALDAS